MLPNFRISEKVVIVSFITDFKFKALLLNMLFTDYSAGIPWEGNLLKCHILGPTSGQLNPRLPGGS